MSWTDPCLECGNPRYACECPPPESKPITKEELMAIEENKNTCAKEGHEWEYTFIVYKCKRCGETSEY